MPSNGNTGTDGGMVPPNPGLSMGLTSVHWAPVSLPRHASEVDISRWPIDRGRNAVNQGGVGGPPLHAPNWRANPTTMPFTAQPGHVYGQHLPSGQTYRRDAGWYVQVTPGIPALPPSYLLSGTRKAGGVPTSNAVQARMAQLLAYRQRVAGQRGRGKN